MHCSGSLTINWCCTTRATARHRVHSWSLFLLSTEPLMMEDLSSHRYTTKNVLGSPERTRVQASRNVLRPGRFATDLLLYDRFDWLSRGDRVGVSMHHLPDTVFRSKDRRHPQIDWDDILPSAKLSLGSLYPHNVGKVRSDVLRYDIEASDLALSQQRCGTLQSRSNLLPSTHGRAEGVSEGDVFLMGEHHLVGLRVPLHELLERSLIVFNDFVKIDRSHEISSCAFLFL